MVCTTNRAGSTSKAEDYKGPTLKTRLMTALAKMELLPRKASLGENNGAYLMYNEWMSEWMNDESIWVLLSYEENCPVMI